MKKKYLIFSALALLAMSVTACGNNGSNTKKSTSGDQSQDSGDVEEPGVYDHDHDFADGWTSDADYHWHACKVKTKGVPCDEKEDYAEHDWDAGVEVKAAQAYAPGTKRYTCQTCNRTKVVDIPATGGNETKGNFTFDDAKLSTAQDIHSANQNKYLTLGINYYHITEANLSSCGANGNSIASNPNQVTVGWNYTAPAGKTVSNYSFVYGQKEDLSDAYQLPNNVSTNSVSFYNPFLGTNYFKVIANLNDGSKEASDIKTFKVVETAPRNIYAGNIPNFRDTGGRTTYAGGKIKQGLIYRGAGNNFDQRGTSPNQECKDILLKQLRVKTEINVANGTGNNINLDGVKVENCFMDYGATPYSNLSRNAERIRYVMNVLSDESNYPVFYHCRIGTDRTGITGMMIGGLLGIPFNEVFQDYCFSNFAPIDGKRYPNKASDPNGDDPAKYIDEILSLPGSNFQEQTYLALRSIGVPAQKLNKIIDIMTEGKKATLPEDVKVGRGKDLVSSVDARTSNDFTNPDVYFPIKEDESVEYTADFSEGEKDIVIYLGSTDSSQSNKLADGISLVIDNDDEIEIVDRTMHRAGFGTTGQNGRTGYMFNLLCKYSLSQGEHTIKLVGLNKTVFNVGSIGVFDHVTPYNGQ